MSSNHIYQLIFPYFDNNNIIDRNQILNDLNGKLKECIDYYITLEILKNIKNDNLEKAKELFKTIEFKHLLFYLDNNKEIEKKNIDFLNSMGIYKPKLNK